DIDRFIGSGTANWRPRSWLGIRLVGGVDFTNRVDTDLCRRDQCAPISQTAISGFKTDNRTIFFDYTANADATASFVLTPTQTSNVDGADAAAIVFSAVGNPDLKPERAREFEIGGEASLLQNRVSVELTYYNKRTQDALIARTVAPSVGASATRFENLGAVVNRCVEGLISAVVVDRPAFVWDVSAYFSYNTNFIADMGGVPPIIGTTTSQVRGY